MSYEEVKVTTVLLPSLSLYLSRTFTTQEDG
jgi:hypothetical protein